LLDYFYISKEKDHIFINRLDNTHSIQYGTHDHTKFCSYCHRHRTPRHYSSRVTIPVSYQYIIYHQFLKSCVCFVSHPNHSPATTSQRESMEPPTDPSSMTPTSSRLPCVRHPARNRAVGAPLWFAVAVAKWSCAKRYWIKSIPAAAGTIICVARDFMVDVAAVNPETAAKNHARSRVCASRSVSVPDRPLRQHLWFSGDNIIWDWTKTMFASLDATIVSMLYRVCWAVWGFVFKTMHSIAPPIVRVVHPILSFVARRGVWWDKPITNVKSVLRMLATHQREVAWNVKLSSTES